VDAAPFLTYLGGFFSLSGATAPEFKGVNQGIYGKYFLEDDRAIRAKLKLNIFSSSDKQSVRNDEAAATTPEATTIDTRKTNVTDVSLAVGYEFRRGRGRVQGFYGGELLLGLDRESKTYSYGNPMTLANPTPTSTTDFMNPNNPNNPNIIGTPATRPLESKGGMNFKAGLGGFVGVEYFIAKQLSLGGEFTLGLNFSVLGQNEVTSQRVENGEVREVAARERSVGVESNRFGVETNAAVGVNANAVGGVNANAAVGVNANAAVGGNIFLLFYF
jgi:hypothetical protein